jgi:hypothetical protein
MDSFPMSHRIHKDRLHRGGQSILHFCRPMTCIIAVTTTSRLKTTAGAFLASQSDSSAPGRHLPASASRTLVNAAKLQNEA